MFSAIYSDTHRQTHTDRHTQTHTGCSHDRVCAHVCALTVGAAGVLVSSWADGCCWEDWEPHCRSPHLRHTERDTQSPTCPPAPSGDPDMYPEGTWKTPGGSSSSPTWTGRWTRPDVWPQSVHWLLSTLMSRMWGDDWLNQAPLLLHVGLNVGPQTLFVT